MASVVAQTVWDESYENFSYFVAEDALTREIDDRFAALGCAPAAGARCFEVGCFPCRYLAHWCLAYDLEANGVDLTPAIGGALFGWLDGIGVKRGEIRCGDAFAVARALAAAGQRFDFVYSVGFLEHFTNYLEVIDLHDALLAPGGLLMLAAPNFRGWVQNALHRLTDSVNLGRHVVESMAPARWAAHLGDRYEVLFAGYVGGFDYWCGSEQSRTEDLLARVVLHLRPLWSRVRHNGPAHSPYCLLIARKRAADA